MIVIRQFSTRITLTMFLNDMSCDKPFILQTEYWSETAYNRCESLQKLNQFEISKLVACFSSFGQLIMFGSVNFIYRFQGKTDSHIRLKIIIFNLNCQCSLFNDRSEIIHVSKTQRLFLLLFRYSFLMELNNNRFETLIKDP